VVAAAGSLAAEVAAGGAAAAASGSAWVAWVARLVRAARAAAYPGERAACAKSHDLTAGLPRTLPSSLQQPVRRISDSVIRRYGRRLADYAFGSISPAG
jgi:hypothetical protein